MNRRVVVLGVVAVALIGAAVAVPRLMGKRVATVAPGTLVLDLGGRYRTSMTLNAVVNWCPVSRVAEIEAVSVDTGFAVALRENDAITKGTHPVFAPDPAIQFPKPSATAAFRWLRQKDSTVVAYRSVAGRVDIDNAGTTLTGSLRLNLLNSLGKDSLIVTGRFAALKVVAMAAGCT